MSNTSIAPITTSNLNNIVFVDGVVYQTINQAIGGIDATQSVLIIPSSYGGASVATSAIPNNICIWDFRNTAIPIGNSSPYTISTLIQSCNGTGTTNRIFNLGAEIFATGGGDGNQAHGESVAFFAGAERSGGSRPIWAINTVTQVDASQKTNAAIGLEVDINNNSGTDAGGTDNANDQINGIVVVSGGSNKAQNGLFINSSSSAGNWLYGANIANYDSVGVVISGGGGGSLGLQIIPPADDTNPAIIVRNAANTATVFEVSDEGNLNGQAGQLVVLGVGGANVSGSVISATGSGTDVSLILANTHSGGQNWAIDSNSSGILTIFPSGSSGEILLSSCGIVMGAATGGSQGAGTINVTGGYYVNGTLITGGGGSGSVTSVAMTVPSILSVSGSPITSTGTLAVSLATQSPNLVFAGPGSGSAATPTFRALVTADLTGVTLPVANGGTGTGSPSLVGGTGITISGSFPNQTITNSGAGYGTWVEAEAPSGNNTATTTLTTAHTPNGTVFQLYKNGIRMNPNTTSVAADFTRSSGTITLSYASVASDNFMVTYTY